MELLGFHSVFGVSFLSVLDGSLLLHFFQLFVESVQTNYNDLGSEAFAADMYCESKNNEYKVTLPLSSLVHFRHSQLPLLCCANLDINCTI